ncbi:hypothetical protein BDQ12DRAFT_687365 [Crucibulum laeve]|uniref:DUF6534 domain-containing protein n=1 Tax=Crucibulum laeve TaxID=68775 RepID=A0A5C3LW69_9AGAR|nr:hypothetical protein BDQ12DRAFT_687365 [Crucibulum laeve]
MPSVDLLYVLMLIGAFLNAILYGVLVVQIFIYFQTYKKDSPWIKCFIFFLLIAETLNTGFDIGMMYEPLILKYATPAATTFFPFMLAADPIMTVIISTPIQMFIAWRIRIISRANWLAVVICIFALISLGGGVWLTYTVTVIRRFARKPELHWPALTWLAASAIADVIITVSLTVSLSKRKTGFSGTDDAINKIIRLTVQTGLITAIFAILDVVCFLVLPHTTMNFVWDFALSKLYTNALISTLNARAGWNNIANGNTANNVLFGDDSSRRGHLETFTSTNLRSPPALTTGTFELEQARSTLSKGRPDLEFGISVAKEIETVHDPSIVRFDHNSSWQ